ncbi:tRNA-dihydrouridine(20a/20b) synthase [NAD(P)+]-like isoform X1 [Neocloeon triangulifer]|uniref:tRNA-dihydrouridine(20a/20b) synthase [NAD(P)+]-like isoform X1 n=1 Tax=Neocloeon triangulifer TaxID=2078957 RepID=UPI00286FA532|nr:tRNA-dihydrouridine(20a/20b) synthase [NAD(P)+]-like isoform X1 [Neocloeon triangulifer]
MTTKEIDRVDVVDLFRSKNYLKISAPMVRYSKLPFRKLVRKYDCDLCFTPMIMADSFVASEVARWNEFVTDNSDRPLIAQFAAKTVDDFVTAAELVHPFCDGIDLNCGCPQRWAMQDGYGARMLRSPELICDLVKQVRMRLPQPFSVSVKIRLEKNRQLSVELCRQLQKCGVTFVSVHGRTAAERKQAADHESIGLIASACPGLPIVANGDVTSLEIADSVIEKTKCAGVMSARGLLQNPALYAGFDRTPLECVRDWFDLAVPTGLSYGCLHRHLEMMLEEQLSAADKRLLHCMNCLPALLEFMQEKFPDHFLA